MPVDPNESVVRGINSASNSMSQLSSQLEERRRRAQPLSDANKAIMDKAINGPEDVQDDGTNQVVQILQSAGYDDNTVNTMVQALKSGKLSAGELKEHIRQKMADGTIEAQQKARVVEVPPMSEAYNSTNEVAHDKSGQGSEGKEHTGDAKIATPLESAMQQNMQQPQQSQPQTPTTTVPAQNPLNNENRVQPTVVPATEVPKEANSGTVTAQAYDAASGMLTGGMPRNDIQAPQLGNQQMPGELSNYSIQDKMQQPDSGKGKFKEVSNKKSKRIDFSKMTVGDAEDFSRNIAPTYNAQAGRDNKQEIEAAKLAAKKEDLKFKAQLQDSNNQIKVGIAKLNAANRRDLANQHAQLMANINESTADSKDKAIMAGLIEDIIDNNADAERALGILRGRNGKVDQYSIVIEAAKLYQKMLGSSQRLEASLANSVWYGSSPLIQKQYRNQNADSRAQNLVILQMLSKFINTYAGDVNSDDFLGIMRNGVRLPGVNPSVPNPKTIPGTAPHIDTSTTPSLGEGKLKNPIVPTIPAPEKAE